VQGVRIVDGDVERVRAAAADIADKFAVFVVTALAQHQQRGAVGKFGVLDRVAVAVDDALGEADHVFQPDDHGLGIPAAHRRIDTRRFGLALVGHGKPPWLSAAAPLCASAAAPA
jgi:hypothetical protein